jgi:iron complex outermembrane receptor protein
VVNAVTPHDTFYKSRHVGTNGQVIADAGSANTQAGVNGSFQHTHEDWTLWGGGGARRAGDYDTPEGKVKNSATRLSNGRAGFGYFKDKTFFSVGYLIEDGRYGVPGVQEFHGHGHGGEEEHEEEGEEELQIDLDTLRRSARFDIGWRNLDNKAVESFRVAFNYLDWQHDELEVLGGVDQVGTSFANKTYVVRAEIEQRKTGRLSGKFGLWSLYRDFNAVGEEALAPPTTQGAFAGFLYEEMELGPRARLQFGARFEYNDYNPEERAKHGEGHEEEGHEEGGGEDIEPPEPRPRAFPLFSGSVGLRYGLGASSALVTNFSVSSRAPALEELYNFGPHVGNLAFEIGNPDLEKETSFGVDFSLRTQASWLQGEINVYYYGISNFVFPAFTGETRDGLRLAQFLQGDSRFVGIDGKGTIPLHEHVLLNIDAGYVDAELTDSGDPLPRIPPLHGRIAVEIPYGGLTVRPEVVLSAKQDRVSVNETPTDGYAVLNVNASYLLARQDLAHIFSATAYNLTNQLYQLHTSFIKDFAPEIGRGIKFTYTVRFF